MAVEGAVRLLQSIGALEEEGEALTVLGRHLAALPLAPATGKLLLWGVLMACLDPLLTVACASAFRSLASLPCIAVLTGTFAAMAWKRERSWRTMLRGSAHSGVALHQ